MMDKEKLYETMGELIYVIAQADGIIQEEELTVLKELLAEHPWASTIQWSFNYEMDREHNDPEDVYKKVINTCHDFGPMPEYDEFIEVMNVVASASDGIDAHEQDVISSFSKDLIARFIQDTEKLRK